MKLRIVEEPTNRQLQSLMKKYPSAEKVSMNFKKITDKSIKDFLRHIPLWNDVKVHYSDAFTNHMGRFRRGTESSPIIILSPKQITQASKKYNVDLETGIQTTIWHELGHALYQYSQYLFGIIPSNDEEKFAEGIAYELWDSGGQSIPDYAEEVLKQLRQK